MLQIGTILISDDVTDKHFICDLEKCKGACCVEGDAGAPLSSEEVLLLSHIIDKIKPFLRKEGVDAIEQQGVYTIDYENETVTPLIQGKECAYVVFENGIARCGIEKAYSSGAIAFRKPVSCHLYPVRIKKHEQFIAVNYDIWKICDPAREKGEKEKLSVREFVKDALIRQFGITWYQNLQSAVSSLSETDKRKADDREVLHHKSESSALNKNPNQKSKGI